MRRLFLVLFSLIGTLPFLAAQAPVVPRTEVRYSVFNVVQICYADSLGVAALQNAELDPNYIRYLSLHNFPAKKRLQKKANIDFVLNSLNATYRRIVQTASLPIGTTCPVVLRVNLKDYGISPAAWDRLAETGSGATPLPDPYFHTFVVQDIQTLPIPVVPVVTPPAQPVTPPAANKPTWQPKLEVLYENSEYQDRGEIYVNAPGMRDVYFDNTPMEKKEGDRRTFRTPQLERGHTYNYELRVTGAYQGQAYDVSTKISFGCGRKTNISLPVPKPVDDHISKAKDDTDSTLLSNKKVFAASPGTALEQEPALRGTTIAGLIKLTNTRNPVLRGDWFVVYATQAPAYYDLIGLPRRPNPDPVAAKKTPYVYLERDFEKLMNADEKAAAKDVVAGITDTRIVTLHNRILHRFNTVTGVTGGYYWRSKDTDTGIDDQDYLNQIVNFDHPNFVATEIIASGRNGLNFYFVADNKGTGLALAAAAVAQHSEAMPCRFQDKQVWVARNCMLCHANGMLAMRDKIRAISQNKIALFIADKTKDKEVALRITEAFSPDPKGIIALDNAKFTASVLATCGLDGRSIAKQQEDLIWSYWDKPVTLERMAWDVGIAPDKLREMLHRGINLDYTLVSILQDPEVPVATLAWERQGFTALMQYVISYKPEKR
jgi:uncharacterized protein (TIGR03000 family)